MIPEVEYERETEATVKKCHDKGVKRGIALQFEMDDLGSSNIDIDDDNIEIEKIKRCRSCRMPLIGESDGWRCHSCRRPFCDDCIDGHSNRCKGVN